MNSRIAVGICATALSAAFVLSGCTSTPATTSQETQDQAPGMTTEKSGDSTLTGKLVKLDGKYYLQLAGKPNQEVDSYSIDLSAFEGKTVTITGQYSGVTLFAGKVDAQ